METIGKLVVRFSTPDEAAAVKLLAALHTAAREAILADRSAGVVGISATHAPGAVTFCAAEHDCADGIAERLRRMEVAFERVAAVADMAGSALSDERFAPGTPDGGPAPGGCRVGLVMGDKVLSTAIVRP